MVRARQRGIVVSLEKAADCESRIFGIARNKTEYLQLAAQMIVKVRGELDANGEPEAKRVRLSSVNQRAVDDIEAIN